MADTRTDKSEAQATAATTETAAQKSQAPETDTIYIPDVDIFEDPEHIRLLANMPGTDEKSVDVTVENSVLTIEGRAHVDGPEGGELVGQEYGIGKYRRDFTLSDAVDTEGIKAKVRHGVLELTIPKREEVKTRKVKIET